MVFGDLYVSVGVDVVAGGSVVVVVDVASVDDTAVDGVVVGSSRFDEVASVVFA